MLTRLTAFPSEQDSHSDMNTFCHIAVYSGLMLVIGLSGCSVPSGEQLHKAVNWNKDHIKMAVRPRYRSIAVMPFFNRTDNARAARYARQSFYGNLAAAKDYELQPLYQTDKLIANLPRKSLEPDNYKELHSILNTDLLAFGEVKEQSHLYGLVFSRNKVSARVYLVDAETGDTVWVSEDSRGRSLMGISFLSMAENEGMWAREVHNRYDELFRDMMIVLPNRSAE